MRWTTRISFSAISRVFHFIIFLHFSYVDCMRFPFRRCCFIYFIDIAFFDGIFINIFFKNKRMCRIFIPFPYSINHIWYVPVIYVSFVIFSFTKDTYIFACINKIITKMKFMIEIEGEIERKTDDFSSSGFQFIHCWYCGRWRRIETVCFLCPFRFSPTLSAVDEW